MLRGDEDPSASPPSDEASGFGDDVGLSMPFTGFDDAEYGAGSGEDLFGFKLS